MAAAKSIRRPLLGRLLKMSAAIPLERAQDVAVPGPGEVVSLQGDLVTGIGTKFTEIPLSSLLDLGKVGEFKIRTVLSDVSLSVFNEEQAVLSKPSKYKIIPKLEYSQMYSHTWEKLREGGCIGVFPEGGSHDRTDLLPLKAGICIMALGAMEKYQVQVTLVSCGFHYYHPENFRSKVVMEYGVPYVIPQELLEVYRVDKRKAIALLLQDVEDVPIG